MVNFCNRLNVDLYLSIHFYNEKNIIPKVWIYYFKNDVFFGNNIKNELAFYPYDKIWMQNFSATKNYAKRLEEALKKDIHHKHEVNAPIAIPFKPLIGIKPPAIGIEISIKNVQDSEKLIPAIIDFIMVIV